MGRVVDADADRWAPLAASWTVLLTSSKRDGGAVETPVNLAVEAGHGYFRTYDKAWKTKRLRNNPIVELAPCSVRGKPRGPAVRATARLLSGDEDRHATQVIGARFPVFQRWVVPLAHRVARYRTMQYELTLVDD